MGGKLVKSTAVLARLERAVRDVPDFPVPGIVFKDITTVLADPGLFSAAIDLMAARLRGYHPDAICAIEARGFLFGAPVARQMGLPLQLVRKPGKLPYETAGYDYELEYGTDRLEVHVDAIGRGQRMAIVDDLLATGGTAAATAKLIEQQGGLVACSCFFIELSFLKGRDKLAKWPVEHIIAY